MNHTFKITSVRVFPQRGEYENVIAKVGWAIEFERDGFKSLGLGETSFDVDGIQGFTPFEQVTKEQIVAWVIEREGGPAFMAMLAQVHGAAIDAKALDAETQSMTLPFVEPPPAPGPIVYDLEQIAE